MSPTANAKSGRTTRASGRKELEEIIETCDLISERKFNPFFLDVKLGVETLRRYFPLWETFGEHCLDAHTINRLSEVVRLQNTQLKFQSSALYADPEFVARKVERMSEKRLAEVFLQSWHPVTELEQLTNNTVGDALDYWNLLLPIEERWKRREYSEGNRPGTTDSNALTGLGIQGKEFENQLTSLWDDLRHLYDAEKKPIDYWHFVRRGSYQDTVQRAYYVSFLVTYGYAELHHDGDQMLLIPKDEPSEKAASGAVSFPIPIPREGQ
jgi:hypothetical protein